MNRLIINCETAIIHSDKHSNLYPTSIEINGDFEIEVINPDDILEQLDFGNIERYYLNNKD